MLLRSLSCTALLVFLVVWGGTWIQEQQPQQHQGLPPHHTQQQQRQQQVGTAGWTSSLRRSDDAWLKVWQGSAAAAKPETPAAAAAAAAAATSSLQQRFGRAVRTLLAVDQLQQQPPLPLRLNASTTASTNTNAAAANGTPTSSSASSSVSASSRSSQGEVVMTSDSASLPVSTNPLVLNVSPPATGTQQPQPGLATASGVAAAGPAGLPRNTTNATAAGAGPAGGPANVPAAGGPATAAAGGGPAAGLQRNASNAAAGATAAAAATGPASPRNGTNATAPTAATLPPAPTAGPASPRNATNGAAGATRPSAAATPLSPAGSSNRQGGEVVISSDSAHLPIVLNPQVVHTSKPSTAGPAAPSPSATSVAAAEAAAAAAGGSAYTGPVVKAVSDVKAGDSCVCWSPDWCTCGWQACPFDPLDAVAAAAQLSDSAQRLFGADVLPQLQLSADAAVGRVAPPLSKSMLQRFNKRISTQLINPLYQFTMDHYILEGAKEVVAAGGDSYKFKLANLDARGREISNVKTPLDMVRSPSLPYAAVFELPLSTYFFWVFPDYSQPYRETYELAAYLLQKYQGTGKQFFIGMWEGDHALRKPGQWGHSVPPDVDRIETLQFVVQEKQRAVDNAKRDLGDRCTDVQVWNYIEANFVLASIWNRSKMSIINWLVPTIDQPPVDYISYSAYEVLFSGDWKLTNLTAAFDYMASRLPDKPGVPGPRVFLGEWAYPMFDPQGKPAWSLEESREKGLYAAAVAIAWGSQFNQYWQLYSNHRFNNNTGDRGFWLILPNRREAPIWTSLKDYFAASDTFLQRFWSCYGGWPSDYTYRVWAVKTLMKLVNNATKPEPVVRELGSTSYSQQARVVADNTFGQFGPTITFQVGGQTTPQAAAAQGSSYIPIGGVGQLANPAGLQQRGRNGDSSSGGSNSRSFTPPTVPNFLRAGGGDRGLCPLPLPMLAPGTPKPPAPPPPPANASANASQTAARPSNGSSSSGGSPATTAAVKLAAANTSSNGSGNSSSSRVQENEKAAVSTGSQTQKCAAGSNITDRLQLKSEECQYTYPRMTLEDVVSGRSKPYAYGGIDRLGCVNCNQKGLWPRFCLWKRTELPAWDSISCNQRESAGRASVQRNLELAVNLSRNWPASTGIDVSKAAGAGDVGGAKSLPPGPAEITPCDVFKLIRGRTLWIIGDSQMKGLYTALKCFMLEFWDLKQYAPTWNTTTLEYLDTLPRNAEARCIHLPDSTRICQLKVLWADTFAERAGPNETRWTVPVWELLQQQLAAPDDIFVLNFGLWYNPANPTRYYNNLQSLGKLYQAAKATFPNMFFVETVKLHWPDPIGDQDQPLTVEEAGSRGIELQCKATDNVVFDARTSELRRVMHRDAAAVVERATGQLLGLGLPVYQMAADQGSDSSSSGESSGRSKRRKLLMTGELNGASISSSSSRTALSWLQGTAQQLLLHGRSLGRSLLQQDGAAGAGGGAGAAAKTADSTGSGGGGGGPLEDSPVFTVLQPPAFAAPAAGQPTQQQPLIQRQASPPQLLQGSGSANSTSTSGTTTREAVKTAFPLLKPAFAANSSSRPSAAAASSPTPPPLPAAAASTPGPSSKPPGVLAATPSPSPRPTPPPPAAAGSTAKPVQAPGFGSVTLPPSIATDAVLTGLWRNQIARAVLRDRFGMPWVPIYNATVPAYWSHRNNPQSAPDCIHYCNPGAPQNWMAKLMLAIAVNTKPLQGEIVDKRCLWGTKVVFEEGEKDFK